MPYVPLGTNLARSYPFTEVTRSKGAGSRPWTEITVTGARTRTLMTSSVVRNSGEPIVTPFGLWKPVRPYLRTANAMIITGGPEFLGNAARVEDCTITRLRTGYPYCDPTTTSMPSAGLAQTGGLVDAGVPVVSSNLRNRLIAECMRKVGDRKINLGESLAESRSTLNHLAKTSSQVLRAYKALRRGNIPSALKALGLSKRTVLNGKSAADRWLELQYGWLPLLSDVYSASEVLREGVTRKEGMTLSATRQIVENAPYVGTKSDGTVYGVVTCTHRCKLFYSVSSSDLDALSRLGLINPLEIAWAVLPYSFVIDWFAPVGTLLEAYSSTVGLTQIDGVLTSRAIIKGSGDIDQPLGLHYLPGSGRFTKTIDYFGMVRAKAVALPLPYVKSPFSSTHLASALALLRQLR